MATTSNTVNASLVGFLNTGFGATSSSVQRDREWNIIKDEISNIGKNSINIDNPGEWIKNARPVVSKINYHVDKWYPHAGANSDLIAHYAQSYVIAEAFGSFASATMGLAVEWADGAKEWYKQDGGAGYSNDDLAADLAGAYGYTPAQAVAAGLFSHTAAEDLPNDYFLDGNTGFLANMKKIWNLWDSDEVQDPTEEEEANALLYAWVEATRNVDPNAAQLNGYMIAGIRSYGVVLASSADNAQNGLGLKGDVHYGSYDLNGVPDAGSGLTMVDTNDVNGVWTNRSVSLSWPDFEHVVIASHNLGTPGFSVRVSAGSASISFDPQVDDNLTKAWPVSISYTKISD